METFTGDRWIPAQRPVTQNFEVFFDLHLNKRWCWWKKIPKFQKHFLEGRRELYDWTGLLNSLSATAAWDSQKKPILSAKEFLLWGKYALSYIYLNSRMVFKDLGIM